MRSNPARAPHTGVTGSGQLTDSRGFEQGSHERCTLLQTECVCLFVWAGMCVCACLCASLSSARGLVCCVPQQPGSTAVWLYSSLDTEHNTQEEKFVFQMYANHFVFALAFD